MEPQEKKCKSCIYADQDQIDRRKFISRTVTGTAGLTFLTFSGLLNSAFALENVSSISSSGNGSGQTSSMLKSKNDTKKLFMKKGTCSTTFFYFLNLEYGHLKEDEEYAASCLAGGIAEHGHQCGMLWGSAMATGAEAYRRFSDRDQAMAMTISSTQIIMDSFVKKTDTVYCEEYTNIDFTKKLSKLKMIFFSAGDCFRLAEKFRPKAIAASRKGLSQEMPEVNKPVLSCASEVAKKKGANDEEAMMVAGFAGGYGLSGHTCGALAAALWMKALAWRKENPNKNYYPAKKADPAFKVFKEQTGSVYACKDICGRQFNSIDEHSEYISNGGCSKLINVLAKI